jgi:hypothetical protein
VALSLQKNKTTIFRHVVVWPIPASRQSFVLLSIRFAISTTHAFAEDDSQSCIEPSALAQLQPADKTL